MESPFVRATPTRPNRLGFHYFPDFEHFRQRDLQQWLPELLALGAGWLTLQAPLERAIPEPFITGLIQGGIQPVLHLPLKPQQAADLPALNVLFRAYAAFGLRQVILFDRPNLRAGWNSHAWSQADLVEQFLDLFVPPAAAAVEAGLTPVFPPLEPGGDYWDTAFLRAALQGLARRGEDRLLERLGLAAYGGIDERPLNWGAGGPERWPLARPYQTPKGQQDQRGFYIFDWYRAISKAALGFTPPIIVLGAGIQSAVRQARPQRPAAPLANQTQRLMTLVKLALDAIEELPMPELFSSLPDEVLCVNFWLLAAEAGSPHQAQAWFQPGAAPLPIAEALRLWQLNRAVLEAEPAVLAAHEAHPPAQDPGRHYLLLPVYEWGVSEWHLELIRPFIVQNRPTIGFSLEDAARARRVTVVGGELAFPAEDLARLKTAGAQVDFLIPDGTSIASGSKKSEEGVR